MTRFLTLALVATLALVPAATAKKKSTVKLSKGGTTLALDAGTAEALTSLGFTVGVLMPGKATDAGIRFPVTNGKVNRETLAGRIKHTGGLSLSRNGTTVELRNFWINIDEAPDLSAIVGDQRVSILDLDVSNIEVTKTKKAITIAGVQATLSEAAATALREAFDEPAFQPGLAVGTATVQAKIKK